jgi:ketosteroid isomerase-like protein
MPENADIFRETLAAFDRRDREAWLENFHEDYELVPSATFPEADPVHGAAAGWDYYMNVAESFERQAYGAGAEVEEISPDKLLIHQSSLVRGRASGADVSMDYWIVTTFREGKVMRDEWFDSRAEALEAAG